jgi:hypothetical protein
MIKMMKRIARKEVTMNRELKHLNRVYITVVVILALSMLTGGAAIL